MYGSFAFFVKKLKPIAKWNLRRFFERRQDVTQSMYFDRQFCYGIHRSSTIFQRVCILKISEFTKPKCHRFQGNSALSSALRAIGSTRSFLGAVIFIDKAVQVSPDGMVWLAKLFARVKWLKACQLLMFNELSI